MTRQKRITKSSTNFIEKHSKMSDNESNLNDNSDNNNSNTQTKMNKKTLSLILARITALENENKVLKDEAKKKSASRNEIEISKRLKSNEKNRLIAQKTFKKHPESSLEWSSSEQESDNVKVCIAYYINIFKKIF